MSKHHGSFDVGSLAGQSPAQIAHAIRDHVSASASAPPGAAAAPGLGGLAGAWPYIASALRGVLAARGQGVLDEVLRLLAGEGADTTLGA